jgi:hypothetical protein
VKVTVNTLGALALLADGLKLTTRLSLKASTAAPATAGASTAPLILKAPAGSVNATLSTKPGPFKEIKKLKPWELPLTANLGISCA